ncbi:MAG: RNA ligase family protein [Rivularia sp. (in: cyanobacteria)]
MSIFKVEVVEISSVDSHPNADRLDIVSMNGMGYQVISAKGNFKVGDLAFYFPIDSVIPDKYVEEFGIVSYYSKKLRAAKLRGIFSEGLLIPVGESFTGKIGDDYTEYFGITKYEYPIPKTMNGEMENHVGHYKFPAPQHLKRYPDMFAEGEEIVVTEKIHGTNFSVLVDTDSTVKIASHNYFWKDNETNKNLVYIRAYHENEALQTLTPDTQVFAEIYGVQDIKYGLKNGQIGIALFAVRRNGKFLDYQDFAAFCQEFNLPTAPLLYYGAYSKEIVSKFNNKDSALSPDCMMEGVVIQPAIEKTHPLFGRVTLKLISDRYLLRKGGSELH